MRFLAIALVAVPGLAWADSYHDLGHPEQCGTYDEASLDGENWFGGGEGGLITLTTPEPVGGLNATKFQGVISEEGGSDPAGDVLALRGTLVTAGGAENGETLVVMTNDGMRVLQACP